MSNLKEVIMEFTGERYVPEVHGNIELEHVHRYLVASEFVSGKRVLDIASGEGYGSAFLAQKAQKVTGVDISSEAIQFSRKRYQLKNLDFKVGSCTDIPLQDASVDIVVSFETIEHLDQHDLMMQEIKRVLHPDGLLIISSPDKYYYSVEPGYSNPFHKKELYEHEFKQLLSNNFKQCAYFVQRVIYGSNIFSETQKSFLKGYYLEGEIVKETSGITKPTYWIGLASNAKLPELTSSVLDQPINESEIVKSWNDIVSTRDQTIQKINTDLAGRDQIVQKLTGDLAERDQIVQKLTGDLVERDQIVQKLTIDLVERDRAHSKELQKIGEEQSRLKQQLNARLSQNAELEQSLNFANHEIIDYYISTSWKITRPLRWISKKLRGKSA